MEVSSTSSSSGRTLQLGDWSSLRVWLLLVLWMMAGEVVLRAGLAERLPPPAKWGNSQLSRMIDRYEAESRTGAPKILITGSSQGYTWIDQSDLRSRGISVFNACQPGANMTVTHLLTSRILVPMAKPDLIVITVGSVSLANRNETFVDAIRNSPRGSNLFDYSPVSAWIQDHVFLVRYGGHKLTESLFTDLRQALTGRASKPETTDEDFLKPIDGDERVRRLEMARSYEPSDTQVASLADDVKFAREQGIRVLVINMPIHPEAKIDSKWPYPDYLRRLREAIGDTPMLDMDAEARADQFFDFTHCTPLGREQWRERIASFIAADP